MMVELVNIVGSQNENMGMIHLPKDALASARYDR